MLGLFAPEKTTFTYMNTSAQNNLTVSLSFSELKYTESFIKRIKKVEANLFAAY